MSRGPCVVAVIPARGGSKRVPGKNLAPLGGKPLLAHTIEAARAARLVGACHVSTDDVRIAQAARRAGASVILRPPDLATDTSPSEDALLHALAQIEAQRGAPVDVVVMLQCTSPFRSAARIDEAIRKLLVTGCDSVVSVTEEVGFFLYGRLDGDRYAPGFDPRRRPRTQEGARGYKENGAIYVVRRDLLVRTRLRMGGDMRALVMSPGEALDIDGPEDLAIAEAMLAARARMATPAPRAAGAVG